MKSLTGGLLMAKLSRCFDRERWDSGKELGELFAFIHMRIGPRIGRDIGV